MKKTIAIMCLAALLISCTDKRNVESILAWEQQYADPTQIDFESSSSAPSILDCTVLIDNLIVPLLDETIGTSSPIPREQKERVYRNDIPLSQKLQDDVEDACQEFGVPEDLLYAVMSVESGYQVDASNGKCVGLMQIHKINYPMLSEQIGVVSLDNPTDNIRSGAYILGRYLKKYDVADSLMAYNLGEAGAKELWQKGTHETRYTKKVLDRMKGV